jgi:hypothetical protein
MARQERRQQRKCRPQETAADTIGADVVTREFRRLLAQGVFVESTPETEAQVRAASAARKAAVRQAKSDPEAARKLLFEDAMQEYCDELKSVTQDYHDVLRDGCIWISVFEGIALSDVTPQVVEKGKAECLRLGISPTALFNRLIPSLNRFFSVAIKEGLVEKNPCAHLAETERS